MIPNDFILHIKQLFGDDLVCLPLTKTVTSNLILKISDRADEYVAKIYNSSNLFNTELAILYKCKGKIKAPEPIYYEEKEQCGWDWILYRYINGISLFELKTSLNLDSKLSLFHQIGRELRSFHTIKLVYKPKKSEKQHAINKMVLQTEIAYQAIVKNEHEDLFLQAINFSRNVYPLLNNSTNNSIVIKDFNDKHILIQTNSIPMTLSGILDFEQSVYSNNFTDMVSLYVDYFFDDANLELSFWCGYGKTITHIDKKIIAFFLLQHALELCGILHKVQENNKKTGENIISKVFKWLQ